VAAPTFDSIRLFAVGSEKSNVGLASKQTPALSGAQISGWAERSRGRKRVSCVILRSPTPAWARASLPQVSDALTEVGYPWEVVVIDPCPETKDYGPFALWTQLPGFRVVLTDGRKSAASAFRAGLCAARGDAVILLDDASDGAIARMPEVLSLWENGNAVISMDRNDSCQVRVVANSPKGVARACMKLSGDASLAAGGVQVLMLDRQATDALLHFNCRS
jgi:hypothetical protein